MTKQFFEHPIWNLPYSYQPYEIGVFVMAEAQTGRAREAVRLARADYVELGEDAVSAAVKVAITIPRALSSAASPSWRAMTACCRLKNRSRLSQMNPTSEEVYDMERHLLYVACARARDCLLIMGVAPKSEFLADLTVSTAEPAADQEASGMASTESAEGGAT